jgi:chemotaxis protein histidine kinase CheA
MAEFDLGFSDDYGQDDDHGEGGRRVDHLPPPPEIGGSPGYSDIHGAGASVVGGRSTSPRLFTQAAGHPTVHQLRVWKIENGVPVGLGAIDATASEDDLVRHFAEAMPKPGESKATFKVRPIDGDGREMGMEASVIIGEHHAALQRQRRVAAAANAASMPVPGSTLPTDVLRLMERAIDQTRASLDAERTRSRDLMEQIADERMNVASNATTSIQAMSEKMLDAEAQRARMALESAGSYHQQAADNQAAFFQTQMDLLRQDRAREGERAERERMNAEDRFARTLSEMEMQRQRQAEEAERRRREEREAWERRMEELRLENERKAQEAAAQRAAEAAAQERRWKQEQAERAEQRQREALEREERDKARQRDHEMKLRQMELEQSQQREHAERMMQLQQAQLAATMAQAAGKTGGIKQTLKEITGVLAMLGMEPRDVIDRLTASGGGEGGGGAQWAELAGKLMGTVGEVAKAKMIADAHGKRPAIAAQDPRRIAQIDPRQVPPPPGLMAPGMQAPDDWEEDDWEEDDDPPEPPPARRPSRVTMRSPALQRRQARRERRGVRREAPPAADPEGPPAAPAGATIALADQRSARVALRKLADRLQSIPRDEWEAAITVALTTEPSIYAYCQQKTVRAAVLEASNGNAEFTRSVIAALRESPLVPEDMNYGDGQ